MIKSKSKFRPHGFTGKFPHIFREWTSILLKLFQNCRGRDTFKLIMWGNHHPGIKIRQKYHKKENCRGI